MESPPCRLERTSSMPRDDIAQLLRHGMTISDPKPEFLAAATQLEQLGLIKVEMEYFVRCVDPKDSDYLDSDQRCAGLIYVPENVEESIDDFCCLECDRWVFPAEDKKQIHQELRSAVLEVGVDAYLQSLLITAGLRAKKVCDGVLRVDVEPLGVFLCVAEHCPEPKFLLRDWPAAQPTCYVLVNERLAENRFLNEEWLQRVYLADLVCGGTDLSEVIDRTAKSSPPAQLPHVVPEVYGPVLIQAPAIPQPPRRFVVELASKSVWVEGIQVVAIQAGPRLEIFRILWEQFTEDLRAGLHPQDYHTCPLRTLVGELETRRNTLYSDETTVRRNINRLQADIETSIKRKLGLAISREDIIETCSWKGHDANDGYGYRLNPCHVALRPCRSDIVGELA